MPINKPKISSLVPSQLPEFIREDYQAFTAFMQAYYEFLRLNYDVDLLSVRDIDNTLDEFIKYFKNEFTKDIPNIPYLEDRFLIKHIKDYYLAKGSQVSFDIMLSVLFGKTMTVDYPSRQMLRASDGKWNQDVSVFAKINAGDPAMIVGRMVDVVTPQKVIRVQVNKTQNVEIEVDRIRKVVDGIYELYLDRRFFGKINIGDRIRYADIFDATIQATTAKVTINRTGKGFKVGELYNINNGNGQGSVLKVSRVNDTGGILAAEFVRFGIGYTTDFTATLIPNGALTNTTAGSTFLNIGGVEPNLVISFGETTNGFTEQGSINRSDYVVQTPEEVAAEGFGLAWDGTYSGDVVREFYNDSKAPILDADIPALIKIELGPLTKYPGYYTTNDGFLSDAIFIQDSHYYQAFSYVLKIDERLENYKSFTKTLLHPAGMAMFGEYDIRNELDISTALECMLKYLVLTFQDNVVAEAQISFKGVGKAVGNTYLFDGVTLDNNSIGLSDSNIKTFNKLLNFGTYDYDGNLDTNSLSLTDTVNTKAFGKSVNSSYLNDGTTLDDNTVSPLDSGTVVSLSKPLFDTTSPVDVINAKDFGKLINSSYLFDGFNLDNNTITPTDYAALLTTKPLSDTIDTPSDSTVTLFSKVVNSSYLNDGLTLDDNTVTMVDSGTTASVSKPLSDSQNIADSSSNFIGKMLDSTHYLFDGVTIDNESFGVSDLTTLLTTKYINDDAATPTDSGGYIWFNPYTDPYPVANSYFLNDGGDYIAGETTFTG